MGKAEYSCHQHRGWDADLLSDFCTSARRGAGPSPDTEFRASSAFKGNRHVLLSRDIRGKLYLSLSCQMNGKSAWGDLIVLYFKKRKKFKARKNFRLRYEEVPS